MSRFVLPLGDGATSTQGVVVAVVGAESTGKTTLALSIASALRAQGHDAVMVGEFLREFCDAKGRTPFVHEQAHIAAEQTNRIATARAQHAVVVADTTALMTATYSEFIFDDTTLWAQAMAAHRQVGLTLLTALDLPWVPDGHQRDGAHVQPPVDAIIRRKLVMHAQHFAVVGGQGAARLTSGMQCVQHWLSAPERAARQASQPRWRWVCEDCDDGDCEQHTVAPGGAA
jgi:nicotinamide riboside kinase